MKATFVKSYARVADMPKEGPWHIAMLGRSNAGKSSLINHITGIEKLARVSALPGRTRFINVFDMGLWHLVDLPGYGFASASKKELIALREMVADYLSESPRIALCLLIVDSRIGMTPLDVDIAQQLQSAKLPFIIIANKIDKLSHSERAQQLSLIERQFSGVKVIPHSTVTHEGKGLILDEMHRMIKEASPLEPME